MVANSCGCAQRAARRRCSGHFCKQRDAATRPRMTSASRCSRVCAKMMASTQRCFLTFRHNWSVCVVLQLMLFKNCVTRSGCRCVWLDFSCHSIIMTLPPFLHNWPFSGLPLFQEQDIMYFCYACRNEIFCECKSQRAYIPGSERSRKLLLPGTKIPRSEHSNNILSTPVVYLYCYCFVIAKRRSCECI